MINVQPTKPVEVQLGVKPDDGAREELLLVRPEHAHAAPDGSLAQQSQARPHVPLASLSDDLELRAPVVVLNALQRPQRGSLGARARVVAVAEGHLRGVEAQVDPLESNSSKRVDYILSSKD
jgi:hypothetical protein